MILLLVQLAHADVVFPPPDECPPGSSGRTTHGYQWCEPQACEDSCTGEGSCTEGVGLCVTEDEARCGGRRADPSEPCTWTKRTAHGTCATDADCETGSCEVARRCVVPGPTGEPATTGTGSMPTPPDPTRTAGVLAEGAEDEPTEAKPATPEAEPTTPEAEADEPEDARDCATVSNGSAGLGVLLLLAAGLVSRRRD